MLILHLTNEEFTLLGVLSVRRFENGGDLSDLTLGIAILRKAVALTPPAARVQRCRRLNLLATALFMFVERTGDVAAIEEAITASRSACDSAEANDVQRPMYLSNLGNALLRRFDSLDQRADIEDAIAAHRSSVDLGADSDPNKAGWLSSLGTSLFTRFLRFGDLADLDEATEIYREAVLLEDDESDSKLSLMQNLGDTFAIRFSYRGDKQDLDEAFIWYSCAKAIARPGHSDFLSILQSYAEGCMRRFEYLGDMDDLEESIREFRRVCALTSEGDVLMPRILYSLGNALCCRFERLKDPADIVEALSWQRSAIELVPDGLPDQCRYICALGFSFKSRFERFRDATDLDEAVAVHKRAVDVTPIGHLDRPLYLAAFGSILALRFTHSRKLADIEKAVQYNRQALELCPPNHRERCFFLGNLSNSLFLRWRHCGRSMIDSFNEILSNYRSACELAPHGCARDELYMFLGTAHRIRFLYEQDPSHIEEAINAFHHALNAFELSGHLSNRLECLQRLGDALLIQFLHSGVRATLEDAITRFSEVLSLMPDDNPRRPDSFNDLANALKKRFECAGAPTDIQNSIMMHLRAVETTPDGDYLRTQRLANLGRAYSARLKAARDCEYDARVADFNLALVAFAEVAHGDTFGTPDDMFYAALHCTELCAQYPDLATTVRNMGLSFHARVMELVPEVVSIGHSLGERMLSVSYIGDVVNTAVAAAITAGDVTLALEWFEAGRAIIWGQMHKMSTPIDNLLEAYPDHGREMQRIRTILKDALAGVYSFSEDCQPDELNLQPPSRFDWSLKNLDKVCVMSAEGQINEQHRRQLEAAQAGHRLLAKQYQDLLREIRQLNGFENFLRAKSIQELAGATSNGPVACINIHSSRCDALVLCRNSDCGKPIVVHVPLTQLSLSQVQDLRDDLEAYLNCERARKYKMISDAERRTPARDPRPLLEALWNFVVYPVLDALTQKNFLRAVDGKLPHITWCTTGPLAFLPLHAAGKYIGDDSSSLSQKAFETVVSSYTPSLISLISNGHRTASKPSLLLVTQAHTPDGVLALPGAADEGERIRTIFSTNADALEVLEGPDGTMNAVIEASRRHPWIHLACHGTQHAYNSLRSTFLLHDGPLTLSRLLMARGTAPAGTTVAELAFLSACETATGDGDFPDESMHLAAGVLATGFKSVVATMWQIGDREAPIVAEAFYKKLLEESAASEGELDVARALHHAVSVLRKEVGEQAFSKWMPFVHFGI